MTAVEPETSEPVPSVVLVTVGVGAAAKVAPTSIAALRVVGVLSLALSFLILWRWSTETLGRDTPAAVRAWPLSLAALSPLVTQGSVYLDIDNTFLATGLLLFVWRFARPGDDS